MFQWGGLCVCLKARHAKYVVVTAVSKKPKKMKSPFYLGRGNSLVFVKFTMLFYLNHAF